MKLSLKKASKNLLVVWGFSYVIVISILLVVISVIIFIYHQTIKRETNKFNNYVFETVTSSVNDVLLDINNLHLNLLRNNNLLRFLQLENVFSNEITYDLLDDIRAYDEFLSNVDLFFVYLKDMDKVLSRSGIIDSYTYYVMHFESEELSFEEWKKILTDKKNYQYMSMQFMNNEGKKIDATALFFQIHIGADKGMGVILSDTKRFINKIGEVEWKTLCDIYIYNSAGNLVIYSKNSESGEIPQDIGQVSIYDNKDNSIHISHIPDNKNDWKVVTIVQNDILNKRLSIVQIIIMTTLTGSILILFFILKYILNKNYRPIKTLLSFFGITEAKNEYDVLYKHISKTLNTNIRLLDAMEDNKKKLQKFALAEIINGNFSHSSIEEYDIEFKGEYFAVLSFYLENISEFFDDEKNMSDFERRYHLSYIINNVMNELFTKNNMIVYTTEIYEFVVCLINLETKTDVRRIKEISNIGLSFINENFDISLTFALSNIHEGILSLPDAYNQTVELFEYKRILGIEEPMLYTEMGTPQKDPYIFSLSKERSLVNSIKKGNHKSALKIVKSVLQELEGNKSLSLDYIMCVVLDIAMTVTKSASEIIPKDFNIDNEIALYKKIKNSESLNSLNSEITEYIVNVCDVIKSVLQNNKENTTQLRVEYIKKYVNDNYMNPQLSISSIGELFNMSPSYVARIFINETNMPLANYINKVRIERAMELEKDGKYSKKQIVEMVGFTNERTFYRAKKKVGG